MTPLEIQIALHYRMGPNDFPNDSPAARDAVQKLVNAGLLVDTHARTECPPCPIPGPFPPPRYVATDGLALYVDRLQAVPFPVLRWSMPE